jgi:hypothetical protein
VTGRLTVRRGLAWPVTILAVAAAVRGLRFWADFVPSAHADEVRLAIPALQILGGTIPVHHLGVEYHGAAPAYPLAAWFALVGVSTGSLDAFSYLVGLAGAATGYWLACRLLPRPASTLAGLVIAVPPLLVARWSLSANLNYPLTFLLGHVILLGTHRLYRDAPLRGATALGVGLAAGVGWWTNPLIVVYCFPLAVLALRRGLVFAPRFWLVPLGVLLGGLPDWLYEVTHFPTTRFMLHEAGSFPTQSVGARAAELIGTLVSELLGAHPEGLRFAFPSLIQVLIVGIGGFAVVRAAARDRDELRWLAGAGGQPGSGLALLWAMVLGHVGLMLFTQRTLGATYCVPLYAALSIWTGEALAWLWFRWRWLGGGALAILVASHLWISWEASLGGPAATGPRWTRLEATARPLVDWLLARDIHYVQWAAESVDLASFDFTFLSANRVIASHLWHEAVVQHGWAVDAVERPLIVAGERELGALRASLTALGLGLRETRVGRFVVVEPTVAPGSFAPVAPDGWTVTASHGAHEAWHLLDRDVATSWSTGDRQRPGQWLAVDLGKEETVGRVDLLAIDWQEVPAAFRVEWSRDTLQWHEAVTATEYWGPLFLSEGRPFLRARRGRVQAIFSPVRCRFLRIVQLGESVHRWAARELFVYAPAEAGPPSAEPSPKELVDALERAGIRMVYTGPWLSARVLAGSRGALGALDSNINVNSYGRTRPEPTMLERFRLEEARGLLLGRDGDSAAIRAVLARRGVPAHETAIGPYQLLALARPKTPAPLSPHGWRASATLRTDEAGRMLDGDPRTRWSAGRAVDPSVHVTVDLGATQRIAGVRLQPGSREGGPSTFVIEGSTDGVTWRRLEPLAWAGPLYWTGYELLRNSRQEWAGTFPPTAVRYLRLRPAESAPRWEIEEVAVYE